jgi:hypothetical protein
MSPSLAGSPRDRRIVLAGGVAVLVVLATVAGLSLGANLVPGDGDRTPFVDVAAERGLVYETAGINTGNGDGGVFVTDYDDDGWPDLLAVGGAHPVLFENTGGQYRRADVLPELSLTDAKGALFFDYDNDGRDDLLLVPREGRPVFLENANGSFRVRDVGFDRRLTWGVGASAADYDGDGCLDVFVVQNGDWRNRTPERSSNPGAPAVADNGEPNLLYDGDCSSFERVTDAGVRGTRWSTTLSFVDLTGDGRPDVHVANDYNFDVFYRNRGDGTFERREIPETNRNGMASDVADVTGDGRLDVFVTNIRYEDPSGVWVFQSGLGVRNTGNSLLVNRDGGTFDDRARTYGVEVGGWGWAGHLDDLDNDGDLDLFHTTKHYLRGAGDQPLDPVATTPRIWERTGPETFEPRNASALGFEATDGRGAATVDFDRDGDLDVVVADTSGPFRLYENTRATGSWLQVRVEGPPDGPALGSRVTVTTSNDTRVAVVHSGANFLSQNPRTLHVGLADAETARVRVVWPDGTTHVFTDVPTDRRIVVSPDGELTTATP